MSCTAAQPALDAASHGDDNGDGDIKCLHDNEHNGYDEKQGNDGINTYEDVHGTLPHITSHYPATLELHHAPRASRDTQQETKHRNTAKRLQTLLQAPANANDLDEK